jgi:hypothetical protein
MFHISHVSALLCLLQVIYLSSQLNQYVLKVSSQTAKHEKRAATMFGVV